MASNKNTTTLALVLLINLVFFAASSSAAVTVTTCPIQLSLLSGCGLPLIGSSCCSSFAGLTDLEAAVCLCASVSANVLGISIDVNAFISATLGKCNRALPSGYTCSA